MKSIATALCVASVLTVVTPFVLWADEARPLPQTTRPTGRSFTRSRKQRNDSLEKRLSLLEDKSTQDVYVVKEKGPGINLEVSAADGN